LTCQRGGGDDRMGLRGGMGNKYLGTNKKEIIKVQKFIRLAAGFQWPLHQNICNIHTPT